VLSVICNVLSSPCTMLPPFYLGAYPATDIDYGLFDLSELEHARKTLLLILKKVDEGKRARVAVDLLRQRIVDNFRPRNTEEEEFHKLTSSLRYGYLLGSKADAKIDLSWVPIPVFLGLVEHLSSQPLTALSMSRKATYLAFASLWSRPLNRKVQERYYHYLCKEHPPWAQKFREGNDTLFKVLSQANTGRRAPVHPGASHYIIHHPSPINTTQPEHQTNDYLSNTS
jgi:hypothetical protein